MRICLYTETALPKIGGQELVVDALARQFVHAGHQVVVLAPRPRGGTADDAELPYRVQRHPRFVSTRHFLPWYRRHLVDLHREFRFSVLHCHSVYPCGYLAALAQDKTAVPTVITSHGGDIRAGNARLSKRGLPERFAYSLQRASALIAISQMTAAAFQRLSPHLPPVHAIPNGVDLTTIAQPVDRPVQLGKTIHPREFILFLGRLHRRKGVDLLIESFARVASTAGSGMPKLVIAGDGDERPHLEALARQRGLADRVVFTGFVQGDLKSYLLQNAICMAAPSRGWEAFPLIVLEGYAAGCPIIGTNVDGLREVIEPGRTGWLVEPESPDDLAEALREAIQDRSQTQRLGMHANQKAADYGWSSVAEQHLQLYSQLVDQTATMRRAA